MKVPPHMLDEIVNALGEVFAGRRYADRVIEFTFKRHRKWGSRDRRLFAESIYECVRWWRWFWHLAGLPDAAHANPDEITPETCAKVWSAYWLSHGRELPRDDEHEPLLTSAEVHKRTTLAQL